MATGGIATERSPSFSLPLRFFLLGLAGFVLSTLALAGFGDELVAGTTWSPHLLALTHLFTLGCVLPMVMGASYQLVPVVLMARIRSEGLGKLAFWPYLVGVTGMVAGFWAWSMPVLLTGAILVLLGIGLFLVNIALSLWHGAQWGPVGNSLVTAIGFLAFAATLGILRVCGFAAPSHALPVPSVPVPHAHLAALGFASLLIYGVSYRLIPMFAVAPEEHRWGRAVLLLGASGTIGIVTGSVFASQAWIRAGAVAASVGAWLWAADMAGMLRRRTRRRIDAGLAYVITAIAFLLIASAIGLSLAWTGQLGPIPPDRAAIAYALLGLVGWIGFSIIGQFHKILPFLAWYHRYSSLVGTRRVPLIKDLFDFRIAWVGYGAAQIGIVALVVGEFAGSGLAVRLGGGGLAVGGLATAMMVAQCLTR